MIMEMISRLMLIIFVIRKALADDCNVVPMSDWAGEISLRKEALTTPVGIVIIQHTATPEPSTDEQCERILKAIRKYQRETLHFDDTAESFLVCGNGKVYEGAGWAHVGAHTRGFNRKAIGISFIGNFESHLPSIQSLTAAQELIACGVRNGHLSPDYKLMGHRQATRTVSPGDALQKEVETWPRWTSAL